MKFKLGKKKNKRVRAFSQLLLGAFVFLLVFGWNESVCAKDTKVSGTLWSGVVVALNGEQYEMMKKRHSEGLRQGRTRRERRGKALPEWLQSKLHQVFPEYVHYRLLGEQNISLGEEVSLRFRAHKFLAKINVLGLKGKELRTGVILRRESRILVKTEQGVKLGEPLIITGKIGHRGRVLLVLKWLP